MIYILFALGIVLVIWGLYRYALSAPPATVARNLRRLALGLLAAAAVTLLVLGQTRLAAVPGVMLVPLLLSFRRRRGAKAGPPDVAPGDGSVADMTREEAAEILGVAPDAAREDIIAAHARQKALRQADGASRWATARLDRAREILLGSQQ
jgi:hypothetical protein